MLRYTRMMQYMLATPSERRKKTWSNGPTIEVVAWAETRRCALFALHNRQRMHFGQPLRLRRSRSTLKM